MITVSISNDFLVIDRPTGAPTTDQEGLERDCATIMEELQKLSTSGCRISDPAVSLDMQNSMVTLEVEAAGEDFDDALSVAESCFRSAIHAAGGFTPTWDVEKTAQRAERRVPEYA